MRAKTIKHAEFEILKYLLTGRGTNLAECHGLFKYPQKGGLLLMVPRHT